MAIARQPATPISSIPQENTAPKARSMQMLMA